MAKNTNLHNAKRAKNDEFFTQLSDIEKEISHYDNAYFEDKVVLCNCNDGTKSKFWEYFHKNFKFKGLKKLVGISYALQAEDRGKVYIYDGGTTADADMDLNSCVEIELRGSGDFREEECIEYLKEADVVVTNPPFSLFREYVAVLMEHNKKFLIIGNMNAITYKEFFPLIRDNKVWVGINAKGGTRKGNSLCFTVPDSYEGKTIDVNGTPMVQVSAWWYTNLDFAKRHQKLILWKEYTPEEYPKYDNYDAIDCGHSDKIPKDYDGVIGVPISFLNGFYCPEQFEIVGFCDTDSPLNLGKDYSAYIGYKQDGTLYGRTGSTFGKCPVLILDDKKHPYYEKDGVRVQATYHRVFIRKKAGV